MIEKQWRPADFTDRLPEVKPPADPDDPEGIDRIGYVLVALFAGIMLLIAVVVGLAMYGHPSPVVSQ